MSNDNRSPSGRLANQGPAMQNIPIRTELGSKIRRAFTDPGHPSTADYSQSEERILRSQHREYFSEAICQQLITKTVMEAMHMAFMYGKDVAGKGERFETVFFNNPDLQHQYETAYNRFR